MSITMFDDIPSPQQRAGNENWRNYDPHAYALITAYDPLADILY